MSQIVAIFVTKLDLMSITLHSQIIAKITEKGFGSIIFPSDFIELGDNVSIRKSLSRLVEQEFIIRLSQGIYLFPKKDKELGLLQPSVGEIVEAIARRDKIRVIPTGIQAIHKLGLSTQVPMKMVFLTDGSSRKIILGKRTIILKRTNPKKLAIKGEISGLIIQALAEIGEKNITEEVLLKIKEALSKEKMQFVIDDVKIAPAWIRKIIMLMLKK